MAPIEGDDRPRRKLGRRLERSRTREVIRNLEISLDGKLCAGECTPGVGVYVRDPRPGYSLHPPRTLINLQILFTRGKLELMYAKFTHATSICLR